MIKFFADAGSNLLKTILKNKGSNIKIMPMVLTFDDKEFVCYEEDIDIEEFSKTFYDKVSSGTKVRTSLVNPETFYNAFKEEIEKGNDVICFTMASGISGTHNAANIAKGMIEEEFPNAKIAVIDSRTAGFGEGLQAFHAESLANQGLTFEEVVEQANDFVLKTRSEFIVDDINQLASTGRINSVVAKIASVLHIKVILKGGEDAKIQLYKKCVGTKMAFTKLTDICAENIRNKDNQVVYISHCACLERAKLIEKMLHEKGVTNTEIYPYDLITGSHLGKNAVAIFYVGENRE